MTGSKASRVRLILALAILVLVSFLLSLICCEIEVQLSLTSEQRSQSNAFAWGKYVNLYYGDVGMKCAFQEVLIAHPFLGWVYGPYDPSCHREMRNNMDFWDRQSFPQERDPNYFTILVTGGSVASQFAYGSLGPEKTAQRWLEDRLNHDYVSPNRKPFRVLSAAVGGWREPTQVIATALYADRVDAVIALDGYNEALNSVSGKPIDYPDFWTTYAAQNSHWISFKFQAMRLLNWYRFFISGTPVLRDSRFLFWVFEKLLSVVYGSKTPFPSESSELNRTFSFPSDWTEPTRISKNITLWKKYLTLQWFEARALKIKYAHFIQPIPSMDKNLTTEEKSHLRYVSPQVYQMIILEPAEQLRREGQPIMAITDVFKNENQTIYADDIHCAYFKDESGYLNNHGYQRMAEVIASRLASSWGLVTKSKL